MTPAEPPSPEVASLLRDLRRLQALTACLLAVLVVGLGVGAWLAAMRLGALETQFRAQAEPLGDATYRLAQEATRHQSSLSAGLVDQSQATRDRLAGLSARRERLSGHPGDPLGKLDRVIDLNALLADELLLLLRHAADSQREVGKGLRPLSTQQELTRRGAGP